MKLIILVALLSPFGCKKEKDILSSEICVDDSLISENDCYEIYDPVCGCDNETYPNNCYAQNAGVLSWIDGECI